MSDKNLLSAINIVKMLFVSGRVAILIIIGFIRDKTKNHKMVAFFNNSYTGSVGTSLK